MPIRSTNKLRFSNSLPVKMLSIIPLTNVKQLRLTEGQTKLLLNPNNDG